MEYKPQPDRYTNGMLYRRCGDSGIQLPVISLGFWHNFGNTDCYATGLELVEYAFDHGVCHFDLANNYGPPAGSAEERKSDNGDCKNEFHNHILWIEPIPSTLPGQNLPGTKILLTWIMQVEFLPKNGCRPASADNQAILSPFSFSLSINSLGENPNFFLKHVLKYFGSLNPEA